MPKRHTPLTLKLIAATTAVLLTSCDDEARRVAREAADRQAAQNQLMANLQQEVAGGARALVEADAEARSQALAVHRDFQAERQQLAAGWQDLEAQRQGLAAERRAESLLVPLLEAAGMVLLAALGLGFSWYALRNARQEEPSEFELNELLVSEFVSGAPPLLTERPEPGGLLKLAPREEPNRD